MRNTTIRGARWRRRLLAPAALAACSLAMLVPAGSGAASSRAVMARSGNSGAQDFQFPGADTLALYDGSNQYITYGASAHGRKVPYTISGSGNTVTTAPTINGDAMPHGAGAWVKGGSGIWTPGAFYHVRKGVGRYYLFFTAVKAGSAGQHCVGVAASTSPTSGFKAQAQPLVCPAKANRWAIDADVTTGPSGEAWMTFRDGQSAVGSESALSVVRLSFGRKGSVKRASAPHVMLRSNKLGWTHYKDGKGVTVIENPSALYDNGSWYLFYSGNKWQNNYYATGIAYCGAHIDQGTCSAKPAAARAYFSYAGPRAHYPAKMRHYGLPGNKRGPGAMDVYRARDGQPWVTWNYLTGNTGRDRKSRVGRLVIKGSGRTASFHVVNP